jgi:hypothetical protein
MPMRASDKGISAGDAVGQSGFHQEIKRTINRYRCQSARSLFGQYLNDIVGTQRPTGIGQRLEDLSAKVGQLEAMDLAMCFGCSHGVVVVVIMSAV